MKFAFREIEIFPEVFSTREIVLAKGNANGKIISV
jgi:hypothetical protein